MRLLRVLIVASVLTLFGAACSSDEPEEASTGDTTSPSEDTTPETTDDADPAEDDDEAPDDDDAADAPEDDDEASGGEGFCGLLETDADVDPTTEEGQAMMAEILATAPDELQEPIETLFGIFEQLGDVDEDDEEAMAEVFALMMDPEVIAASEAIEAWGVENCGLEPGFFTGEGTDSGLQDDGTGTSAE